MTDASKPNDDAPEAYDLNHQQVEAMLALDRERQRLGWNVRDLEARSGISVSSMYAWQANLRSPNLANVVALAQTLGFDVVMRKAK